MTYVDGFVLPVPEDKIDDYRKMASGAGAIWIEHGALSYKECVIDDAAPAIPEGAPEGFKMARFHDIANAKSGESVVFAFITYKSRDHRDEVNAKVMNDPRMKDGCAGMEMPFDHTRMAYGGFKAIVDL
jgi:uncharacterized protein YbaA (DUF1428 family)